MRSPVTGLRPVQCRFAEGMSRTPTPTEQYAGFATYARRGGCPHPPVIRQSRTHYHSKGFQITPCRTTAPAATGRCGHRPLRARYIRCSAVRLRLRQRATARVAPTGAGHRFQYTAKPVRDRVPRLLCGLAMTRLWCGMQVQSNGVTFRGNRLPRSPPRRRQRQADIWQVPARPYGCPRPRKSPYGSGWQRIPYPSVSYSG